MFGGFAAGKFALRALGQSLAREFGPKGVHVAHAIIDGGIDTPWGKAYAANDGAEDGKISPDAVSDYQNPEADILLTTSRLLMPTGTCTRNTAPRSVRKLTSDRTWKSSEQASGTGDFEIDPRHD